MKRNFKYTGIVALVLAQAVTSCTKDLNRYPIVQTTSKVVFSSPAGVKEALAKLYGGLSLSGQDVAGYPDINTSDVGSNVFLRNYWEAEELPTDEAVIGWNDHDLQAYHNMNWTPNGYFIQLMYDRIFFETAACNEFLRETAHLNTSGFTSADTANIAIYRGEARFLRAFAYWTALDMFGNVPFTTEKDPVGSFFPKQIMRDSLFNYVESELLAIQNILPPPGKNEVGRADQGAVWALLARLYLNAQVYTGQARYTDCITYCNKIIASGAYKLATNYAQLFETDNESTGEIIFAIRANGVTSQSYGNTTFLVHAEIGGNMDPTQFGVAPGGGWAGLRTTAAFVNLFPDPSGNTDHRAMFYTNGQTLAIKTMGNFGDGYAIGKFKNVSSTGQPGSDPTKTFVDTDFPLFRLAETYLTYAEAVLRGGSGGDLTTALNYVNLVRERAYGGTSGDINAGQLTLSFILDERGRELYWEAVRRTDLIRFGEFTGGTYLWPFKGGVEAGTGVDSHYNLYPISATDMVANPNLKQNPGY
ncbi:MAG TPA: RagB/SusD family nutrient uptake outer membrane protein [Chitinophagaceae bacterium]|nr:RagB/SusD family nutrient uptake outer membrane protein [Chitinophagaceae bacterium]